MATHPNGSAGQHADASATREEALRLLSRLEADRAASEARLEELGRSDPIKDVTGKSSLDRAIEEAMSIVAALEQLEGSSPPGSPAHGNGAARPSNGVTEPPRAAATPQRRAAWATTAAEGGADRR